MKNLTIRLFIVFIFVGAYSCKKDNSPPVVIPDDTHKVISEEFQNDLLFVNRPDFKILTDKPAEFSSSDPLIKITSDGTIERLTSGEVVAIDIAWNDNPSKKTKIYALGSTDNTHDDPYAGYHGELASEAYNSYLLGWQTLQKLPVSNQSYAIILRHGDADNGRDFTAANPGRDEPDNWWKSCDNTLARQLNERGKTRSTELGKVFKDLNYPITRVISSEFCRSVQTAQLINVGPTIVQDNRINHPSHNKTGKGLLNGMIEIMKEQPVDNKMTLVVMHHPVNETGDQGYPTFPKVSPFTWTGAYIVSVSPDKTVTYQGAVSFAMFNYWRNLKLKRL